MGRTWSEGLFGKQKNWQGLKNRWDTEAISGKKSGFLVFYWFFVFLFGCFCLCLLFLYSLLWGLTGAYSPEQFPGVPWFLRMGRECKECVRKERERERKEERRHRRRGYHSEFKVTPTNEWVNIRVTEINSFPGDREAFKGAFPMWRKQLEPDRLRVCSRGSLSSQPFLNKSLSVSF